DGKGRVDSETVSQRQGTATVTTTTVNQYGDGTDAYALGAVTQSDVTGTRVSGGTSTALPSTKTVTSYDWYDGAVQRQVDYTPDTWASGTVQRSYYTNSGTGVFRSASVQDGRPRTIGVVNNALGQAIRRDEADGLASGDPHEIWYRFDGKQIGYVGNNGSDNIGYQASIDRRTTAAVAGPFKNGATYGASVAEFDGAYAAINSYQQGASGGSY
ncbi:hypothetical protein, partial [Sphingomonas sp. DT-204]|uniref:hypothetical protein n=1 Tax=Sphingomonas sp. DT-204 TaxID=3396166 RepID=UPI003F1B9EFC